MILKIDFYYFISREILNLLTAVCVWIESNILPNFNRKS